MAIKEKLPVVGDMAPGRRRFLAVQLVKGGIGAGLTLAFIALVGRPDWAETIAFVGLMAPALLALAVFSPHSLDHLEQAGLALFALLIGYLAALTGGMGSPLLLWLLLVPAEAALVGERWAVMRAGCAAAAVAGVLAALDGFSLLPPSRLTLPLWEIAAVTVLAGLAQAVLVAIAAQDRQRAADDAAAQGTAMVRFLADNATDLITRHTPEGRIRLASPAAWTLLGRPPEELEGLVPAALVHPDDIAAIQEAFIESSFRGRAGAADVRLKHKDGHYVWAEMRCRPAGEKGLSNKEDGPSDIVAVTRDISERKAQAAALMQARDDAMAASRAKSAFLANMSHELRTPLNAIIGFSEMMNREIFGPLGNPRYREYSGLIHESGNHLLDLINGVLDMSKIEAGKFELHEEIFDLEEVALAAVHVVKLQAERSGVAVSVVVAPSARRIFADKRAIKQMLINLLSNGVKFTPRGGAVRMGAVAGPAGVEIAVRDTGAGIAKDDLDRLGKPFEQVEGAQTRGKEGTGLGLALVMALARLHGGEALLESTLGEGTTVRLKLPHAVVAADGSRAEAGAKILPFRAAS